jgi:hypothetical protein
MIYSGEGILVASFMHDTNEIRLYNIINGKKTTMLLYDVPKFNCPGWTWIQSKVMFVCGLHRRSSDTLIFDVAQDLQTPL